MEDFSLAMPESGDIKNRVHLLEVRCVLRVTGATKARDYSGWVGRYRLRHYSQL